MSSGRVRVSPVNHFRKGSESYSFGRTEYVKNINQSTRSFSIGQVNALDVAHSLLRKFVAIAALVGLCREFNSP